MAKLGKQVHQEAVDFLKKAKTGSSAFSSADGVISQVTELQMREAYFNVEWGRVLLALDSDADYQEFKKTVSCSARIGRRFGGGSID